MACFSQPIPVNVVRFPRANVRKVICFFCTGEGPGQRITLGRSKERIKTCAACLREIQARIRKVAVLFTEHTATVERDEDAAVYIDLSPAERRGGTPEGLAVWASLIEDIVHVPPSFGPVKQWCVIQERWFGPRPDIRIYLLQNFVDGRIAACVSDEICRCFISILFPDIEAMERADKQWKGILAKTTVQTFAMQEDQIDALLDAGQFKEALQYYGHLQPGLSAVISQLVHRLRSSPSD